jgi:ABC-type branched-subunit amino acid transport system substrate-binding protein
MARPRDRGDRPGRWARSTSAGLLVVLVASACGTRVPDAEVQRLLSAPSAVGGDPSLAGPSAAGPRSAAGQDGKGGSGGAGGGSAPTSPGAGGGGGGPAGQAGGGGGGGAAACTTNPGATATGVSGDRIVLGATYAESSLVPGQFSPAMDAIQAYVNLVNRNGGVCGRGLDWHSHNDGLNAQRYAENVRHLVEDDRVFALLGSLSAADSGGCGYLQGQRPPGGVPDVGTFALSYCRSQSANHYAPVGSLKQGIYGCCVDWQWLRKRFGFSHPAVHYLDIEISKDQGLAVVDALVRTLGLRGRGDVYQGEHSAAQFSYTGDVSSMRSEGVDGVWSSMDLNGNVKLLRAMCQQSWYPKVVHLEISAYDPSLIERVGAECIERQNVWIRSFHRPFTNPNPEIERYVSTLHQYCPDCRPTTFGLEGWLAAKLFVEVLRKVGPDLTRGRFYRAMDRVRDWTGGDVMGPMTPSDRLIYHCNYMLEVRGDGFFQGRDLACGKFYASGDYNGPPVGP